MDWFRAYHGISTDPKYQVVLRHIASHRVTSRHTASLEIRLSDVTAIWLWLLDFASQSSPRGSIEGVQIDHISIATGLTDEAVEMVIEGFRWRKMISGNLLTAFDKRQPSSTFRMQEKRALDAASHRVTPRHMASHRVTPLARDARSESSSFFSSTTSGTDNSSTTENPNEKSSFDGESWFEKVYSRHPKKKNRNMASTYLSEVKSVTPEEFDRVHGLWCDEWAKEKPQFAPDLAQWILDQGYRYPPNGHGSAVEKSKYQPIEIPATPED